MYINVRSLVRVNDFSSDDFLLGHVGFHQESVLNAVTATFLLICFKCLKENTFQTRKYFFYFTSKTLIVLEIIRF